MSVWSRAKNGLSVRIKLDLRKNLAFFRHANDEVMVVLSGGSDAVASLTAEKLAGRVGSMPEKAGILRKSSIDWQFACVS